jgi:hypothetical protein
MATFNTAERAIQIAPNLGVRLAGRKLSSMLLYATITHTVTATEAATDVINIVDLPVGSYLVPDLMRVANNGAGGTSVVISKLGDASDDDRYSATSIALTAAGNIAVTPTNAIAVTPFAITETTQTIKAVLAGTLPMTVGKKITFKVPYLVVV